MWSHEAVLRESQRLGPLYLVGSMSAPAAGRKDVPPPDRAIASDGAGCPYLWEIRPIERQRPGVRWPNMRDIVIVGHEGVLGLEVLGVLDVFEFLDAWLLDHGQPPEYRLHMTTPDGGPVSLWGGLSVSASSRLSDYAGPIDTLLVLGGPKAREASEDERLTSQVREAADRASRIVSLCTGAFILASAGLLDGRRATTHWDYGRALALRYPDVVVDTSPIYSRDGNTWTSAGVMATFDLLLALVEEDVGGDAARYLARTLVLFLRRTGSQEQFSTQLATQLADRHPIRELQQFIADRPDADLSLSALAERVHMSPRHFRRVFTSEVGMPPGRYVEQARIETARRRLEESALSIEAIATGTGFGSPETFRRVFMQRFGVSPSEYRRRFGRRVGVLA